MPRLSSGPGDAPLAGYDSATLCAGELLALLAGARGVAMVQLAVSWGSSSPLPAHNPFVLELLARAAANPEIVAHMSRAPGGLGLSAILSAKREPFRAWAAHLASFGAQAALVADAPYYKVLIGRVLGYAPANVAHHVAATSGGAPPSPQVLAAVDAELLKLSAKRPSLPWTAAGGSSRGKRKAK
jgi:hypothetical protein